MSGANLLVSLAQWANTSIKLEGLRVISVHMGGIKPEGEKVVALHAERAIIQESA